jgi:hypothetical protein
LKNKFSNEQLYDWTLGKLSALYFQAYQLAMNLGVQAQNAWAFEKGISINEDGGVQPFIQNGHWDNLHQGLLAGEALQLDLQRMEAAYMQQDQRRMEITKTIQLSTLKDGTDTINAIECLQTNGNCVFDLSETLFSKDYPNHYCRQIKSVSISIPAVLGPYQNINATLKQTANAVNQKPNDRTQIKDYRTNQQIAISHAMNDSGMFQLNFNDPRYLPFEGTGAISSWKLSIPLANNPGLVKSLIPPGKTVGVDQLTISEVIMEIKYTALDGGIPTITNHTAT